MIQIFVSRLCIKSPSNRSLTRHLKCNFQVGFPCKMEGQRLHNRWKQISKSLVMIKAIYLKASIICDGVFFEPNSTSFQNIFWQLFVDHWFHNGVQGVWPCERQNNWDTGSGTSEFSLSWGSTGPGRTGRMILLQTTRFPNHGRAAQRIFSGFSLKAHHEMFSSSAYYQHDSHLFCAKKLSIKPPAIFIMLQKYCPTG